MIEFGYTRPEIIPPDANWSRAARIWVSTGRNHTTRVQIRPLGPVGIAVLVLLIGVLALAGRAVLLLGAALFMSGRFCPFSVAAPTGSRIGDAGLSEVSSWH